MPASVHLALLIGCLSAALVGISIGGRPRPTANRDLRVLTIRRLGSSESVTEDLSLGGVVGIVCSSVVDASCPEVFAWHARRPALLPVPDIGPALLPGEQGARELATASQRRFPNRLIEAGHRFRRPTLEQCLRDQLGHLAGETP